MKQERHAQRLTAPVLGNEQARHELVFERVGELLGQLGDVAFGDPWKLLAHDLLRGLDDGTVRGRRGVCHLADAEHG